MAMSHRLSFYRRCAASASVFPHIRPCPDSARYPVPKWVLKTVHVLAYAYIYECTCHGYGSHRTICRGQFSPSTMWVSGSKLESSDLIRAFYLLGHLAGHRRALWVHLSPHVPSVTCATEGGLVTHGSVALALGGRGGCCKLETIPG